MRLSTFASDPKKEVDGVWVPVGENGARLLIARAGNSKFASTLQKLMMPHRQALRNGVLPENVANDVMCKAMAKHVLLGWENIEGEDGEPLVYSTEEAERILKSPKYKDFLNLVSRLSEDAELFRQEEVAEDEKVVKRTSGGTSSGASSASSSGA